MWGGFQTCSHYSTRLNVSLANVSSLSDSRRNFQPGAFWGTGFLQDGKCQPHAEWVHMHGPQPFWDKKSYLYHVMKLYATLITVSAIYDQRWPEEAFGMCYPSGEDKTQQIGLTNMKRILARKAEQDMTSKCSPSPQGPAISFTNQLSLLCLYLKAIFLLYLYLKSVAEYHSLNGSIFTSHLASFVLCQHCPFI